MKLRTITNFQLKKSKSNVYVVLLNVAALLTKQWNTSKVLDIGSSESAAIAASTRRQLSGLGFTDVRQELESPLISVLLSMTSLNLTLSNLLVLRHRIEKDRRDSRQTFNDI